MDVDGLNLTYEQDVAVLTIDRPSRRNALHGPVWAALAPAMDEVKERGVRALIVRGAGGHFSSGMDLSPDNPLLSRLVPAISEQDRDGIGALIDHLRAGVDAIASLPVPVIAAIDGACCGGGLEVALAADLRVATPSAFFTMPELHVGFSPDVGGTRRLTRLIGRARATDMILTGRRVNAPTGVAWGLVNRLHDGAEAFDGAMQLVGEVRRAAPLATQAVLPVLRATPGLSDTESAHLEREAGIDAVCGGEILQGAQAMLTKQDPPWMRVDG